MIRFVLSFSLLLLISVLQAQEGNNWYFGHHAGLSFNYPTPKALHDGALSTFEGCATISDKNGQLLFYTDGSTIWNRNHQPMPNGTGIYGDSSSSNAAIIIPKPGSETIYYIFTSDAQENRNRKGYNYSEVDITLDNGFGDVTANKNILLYAPCSEKLTAVRHANGSDIWIITHAWGSNLWSSYKVSCDGVDLTPVQTALGSIYQETRVIDWNVYNIESAGCLKSSPNGKMIATTDINSVRWEIFNFDNLTGKLSNALNFYGYVPYGIEFSPNSKFVYVSSLVAGRDSSYVRQYDVTVYDSVSIMSSGQVIGETYLGVSDTWNTLNALQLGPDQKIYCANRDASLLSVINAPDEKGRLSNYANDQIDLEGEMCTLGLPVFFPSLITNKNITINFSSANDCSTVNFTGSSSIANVSQWYWDFGDGQTASGQNALHTYISGNEYDASLTVTVNNICGNGTASTAKKINLKRTKPSSGYMAETFCGSKTVAFKDTSKTNTGNVAGWYWDFGDGSTFNIPSPTHTFTAYGSYDITLITTSDGACNGTDTLRKAIIIRDKPKVKINISNACINKKTLFEDLSTVENDSITNRWWSFDDGEEFSEKTFERIFTTRNTHILRMAVQSGNGCSSDTSSGMVTPEDAPVAKFSTVPACVNTAVEFEDASEATLGAITQWYWNFGDGSTSNQQHTQHQYIAPGEYAVKLVAATTKGCRSDTLLKMVQIDSRPIADFQIADGCAGKPITPQNHSTATTGSIKDYIWDTGSGYNVTGENPPLIFNTPGTATVTLIAKTSQGCASLPAVNTVDIQSIPETDFTFGNTCIGKEIQFTNKSSNSSGAIESWEWSFADGNNTDIFEPSHTYNQFGEYTVVLNAKTKNGCSDTAIRTVSITKVNVWAGNDTIIAKGQPLQLNATGAKDYEWQPALYLNDPTINNPVAVLSSDMWYYLTGTTAQGCIGSDSFKIKVYNGPEIYVPTAFTPNGDNLNDIFKPTMPGIKQLMNFSVYNRWGQLVYQTNIPGQGWNGKYKGTIIPGVYVWKLKAVDYNNKTWDKDGMVTLIQ